MGSSMSTMNQQQSTLLVVNRILDYMLSELNIRDFYKMSNPSECKKYVMFLGSKLDKTFYDLDVAPEFKDGGRIFFRPYSNFDHLSNEKKLERQSTCIFVAYYYIRIFQIYGALALTLLEDINATTSSGFYSGIGNERLGTPGAEGRGGLSQYKDRREIRLPGLGSDYRRYDPYRDPFRRDPYRNNDYYGRRQTRRNRLYYGGANLPDNFKFLERYTGSSERRTPEGLELGYQLQNRGGGTSGRQVFFRPPESLFTASNIGFFYTTIDGSRRFLELQVQGFTNNRIKLTGLNYTRPRGDSSQKDLNEDGIRQLIGQTEFTFDSGVSDYTIDTGSGRPLTPFDFFKAIMDKLLQEIKRKQGRTITTTSSSSSDIWGKDPRSSSSLTGFIEADREAPAPLHLEKTLVALTKQKPIPACLARGLQLLKTQPIMDGFFESDICKSKFLVSGDGKEGVTGPGDAVEKSQGLVALTQLFYDFIQYKNPKIVMDIKDTIVPYRDFMLGLAERYELSYGDGDPEKARIIQETGRKITEGADPSKTVKEVRIGMRDRRMEKACGFAKESDGPFQGKVVLDQGTAGNVNASVNALFQEQVVHTANCGSLLRELFKIEEGGSRIKVELNPNVIKKGLPEVDRINDKARDLLVKYYSKCENLYQDGVKKILAAKQYRNNTRRAARAVPSPAIAGPRPAIAGPGGPEPSLGRGLRI